MGRVIAAGLVALVALAPFVPMGGMRQYVLHVIIQIFIWSFAWLKAVAGAASNANASVVSDLVHC